MSRFDAAIARIDAAHAEDSAKDATGQPKELACARRMSERLEKLAPQAPEPLKLAVRCQHLRRWAIRRGDYPEGKVGYLRWRREESRAHASLAGEILRQSGYGADAVERARSMVKKEMIKHGPEAQMLEDVTCLVFLEHEFAAFAPKHDEAKLVDILRKSWAKMSLLGQREALGLQLPVHLRALVSKALA